MTLSTRILGGIAAVSFLVARAPALGADLVEPWPLGFSDMEVFMSFEDTGAPAVVGVDDRCADCEFELFVPCPPSR